MKIFIRDLTIDAQIGIHPHEQGVTQPLVFNLAVEATIDKVATINDTICYESLANIISKATSAHHTDLVEHLADTILDIILTDKRITTATLSIEKPNAISAAAAAGVEITRKR